MQNQVEVLADDMGNVVRQSQSNPEFGHVRLQQTRVTFGNSGWVKKSNISTLLHGKLEDLNEMGLESMESLPGKIVIKEQLEPFSKNDPDRDYKKAGDTGIICCVDGQPIYRKTFFMPDVNAQDVLLAHTNGDAIIVTDVGQHQMVACRYANFIQSKSNITSGGLGTMGFALPAAMGAKMGALKREVVAVIGDGGYQMTIQELGTIFQLQIPVKIVVLNNDFLGMVRQWQQLFFDKRYASTEMVNPDFVAIAKGYYLDSERVKDRKDLKPAVERMIKSKKPYVLEICVEKENNVFPMIPSGASVSDVRLS